MIQAVGKLLLLRLRLWWNSIKNRSVSRKIGLIVVGLGGLGFAGFLIVFSWGIFRFATSPRLMSVLGEAQVGEIQEMLSLLPILFTIGAFTGGIFISFGVLLQTLYLSGDMEFLLSAPIPPRAVFLSKLIQAVAPNLALLTLLSGPALIGLGISQGFSLWYYLLVPLLLGVLVMAGSGLSAILVMAIVRLVAPRRVAEVIGVIGGLSAFICSQTSQFSRLNFSTETLSGIAGRLGGLIMPWNPLVWPGLGLSRIGEGNWPSGLAFTSLTIVLAAALFAGTLTLAERLYFSGWCRVQVGSLAKKKRKPVTRQRLPSSHLGGAWSLWRDWLPTPVQALIAKDYRMYRRDLRHLSQLIMPIVLAVVWTLALIRPGGGMTHQEEFQFVSRIGVLGVALFAGWMFVSRFGLAAFSVEGQQWWIIKISPVQTSHLLLAKFLVAYIPSVLFSTLYLFVVGALQGEGIGLMVYQFIAVILVMATLSSLGLAFGVWSATFDWTDPRKISGGLSGFLGSLASMAFMGLSVAAFAGPPALAGKLGWPLFSGFLLGLIFGIVVCALAGIIPLGIAAKRVPFLGEETGK